MIELKLLKKNENTKHVRERWKTRSR